MMLIINELEIKIRNMEGKDKYRIRSKGPNNYYYVKKGNLKI